MEKEKILELVNELEVVIKQIRNDFETQLKTDVSINEIGYNISIRADDIGINFGLTKNTAKNIYYHSNYRSNIYNSLISKDD